MKIPVTLFVGEKNFVQKGGEETKTGYKRHYEPAFFSYLSDRVDFDIKTMYPLKGKGYSSLRHLANHLYHPIKYRKDFKKDRVKHVMFAEEAFMLNFLPTEKTVVSCLDVIPLVLPNEVSRKYRKFLDTAYKGMLKATRIIANSEYTKKDIVKHLDVAEDKIDVAYPPVQKQFKPLDIIPLQFYKKYGLHRDKKYLLSVGALDLPRKNLKTTLEAFKIFRKEYSGVELLVVGYATLKGKNGAGFNEDEGVRIITDVPDKDLVSFYNLASAFLFPTLYEGFGLPPIEAMACGTPVISSHVASMPEVLGDAALFVDPLDPMEMAKQIEMLLVNNELREKKEAEGLLQAEKFSWKQYADSTYESYKKVWG